MSIGQIATQLKVSKGSVSLWCRDISLTEKQAQRLHLNSVRAGHAGRLRGALKNKQQRIERIESLRRLAQDDVGVLSKRDLLLIAVALFWAEGAKSGSRFMFVNSDPAMILCMYRYVIEVEKVDPKDIFVRIQINRIHEPRIRSVLKFWRTLLNLSAEQFGTPYYIQALSKKVYENHSSYFGIARLGVRKGTILQYKLLGYIDALKTEHLPG
jgi:hypothetical protein